MKINHALVAIAGIIAIGGEHTLVLACLCPSRTTTGRVYEARTVVLAEAVSEKPIKGAILGKPTRRVKLKVLEQFKGKSPSVVWKNDYPVETPGCGADFFIGSKYLIFLDDTDTEMVSPCHVLQTQTITPELRKDLTAIGGDGPRPPQELDNKRLSQEHYLTGMIAFQTSKYDKARDEWNLAAQLDPSNSAATSGIERLNKMNLEAEKK